MHPQLIPEKHPMCGKYMIALVKCREANPVRRFLGECNDITYQLTKCLAEEKAIYRAPRQAKFQEQWAAKRAENEARMAELEAEAQRRAVAKAAAEPSDVGSSSASASVRPVPEQSSSIGHASTNQFTGSAAMAEPGKTEQGPVLGTAQTASN